VTAITRFAIGIALGRCLPGEFTEIRVILPRVAVFV